MNASTQLGQIEVRKPVVLKNVWPKRTLAVRIKELLVELWEPQKRNAELYACLSKEDNEQLKVTLNPSRASFVIGAIEEWKSLWTSGFRSKKSPCLCAQFDNLRIKLYNQSKCQAPRAELTLVGDRSPSTTIILTHTEATFLAGTLRAILQDSGDVCEYRENEA